MATILTVLCVLVVILGSYCLLSYIYGDANPGKWKPLLKMKNDFLSNIDLFNRKRWFSKLL